MPKDSPLKTVADLKGKNIALNKGSNVHYLLVKALEKAGVAYSDIKTSFLPPADARAAFEKGAVDAWVIWEPFLAAAEAATGARQLANGNGVVDNHQFYLASRDFAERASRRGRHDHRLARRGRQMDQGKQRRRRRAVLAGARHSRGCPRSRRRSGRPMASSRSTPDVVAEQQKIADVFFELGLIPHAIKIADAVRRPQS